MPAITSNNPDYDSKPICFSETNQNGDYLFNGVSSGQYLLKPWVLNKKVLLHIQPESLEFSVQKDSFTIPNNFIVTGFSVSGRVLAVTNGWGIGNAKIKLNGKDITMTHTDGSYTLRNIKAGTYTIQTVADDLQFNDHTVKVSLNEPIIPDIIVAAFKVCGHVISESAYTVALTKHSSTFHTQATSKPGTGEWCTYLPSGRFSVEVLTSAEEKSVGIQ